MKKKEKRREEKKERTKQVVKNEIKYEQRTGKERRVLGRMGMVEFE